MSSWEAASVVLERARTLDTRDEGRGEVVCTVSFGRGGRTVEGLGPSLRLALLRAFVRQAFGDTVEDEILRRPQALVGLRADPIEESSAVTSVEDMPSPTMHIGAISGRHRAREHALRLASRVEKQKGPSVWKALQRWRGWQDSNPRPLGS